MLAAAAVSRISAGTVALIRSMYHQIIGRHHLLTKHIPHEP
jgi:uncharacterized membrane protein